MTRSEDRSPLHERGEGRPWPLGVTTDEAGGGVNVAVWAPEATHVWFCLFDAEASADVEGDGTVGADAGAGVDTEERILLPYCDGGVWHAWIADIAPGRRYGLRAAGPHRPAEGLRFNPAKLLIDPYARGLERPVHWDPLMSGYVQGPDDDLTLDDRDSAPVVPKGIVAAAATGPDPSANRPRHALSELIIYEAHLKGISAAHPHVPEDIRGTYAGMAHPAIIDHLTSLGINAVELLPVQAFIDDRFLVSRDLQNYWGYQPIAWFAPEPRYAHQDADSELRTLVHTLHEAGIEVIVDVVYNHTGEGDEHGPTLGPRGLHNTGYYRLRDGGRHYVNDTGTGNTVALDSPLVLRLALDSLRHWAQHYGIDGFRFDLATTVGRTANGFDPAAAVFQAIRQDPVLAGIKLIAEPWDLGPGGYQLGHFPHPWSEWNDRYRDGVRRAWRGDPLEQVDLGARLLGSAELFDHSGRSSCASINFLTAHDGFTLADVVSFARKHNEANREDNRDGHDDNHSDNLGVEGRSTDTEVLAARARRVRGMLATLLMSQGVPMLLAGDEIGNSQDGNNNAYAQDNELGWVDWSAPDAELLDFVRRLITLRRRLPILRQTTFLHGRERSDGTRDVVWARADGAVPTPADWEDPGFRTFVLTLRGAADDPRGEALDGAVAIIVNLGEDSEIRLPEPHAGTGWRLELDSARPEEADAAANEPGDCDGREAPGQRTREHYPALAQSLVVLTSEPERPNH